MVQLIKMILEKIYGILPDSPFQQAVGGIDMFFGDFIPYLNWFVPFDVCLNVMTVWLGCISAYYIYSVVKKIVFDLIIGKLIA